MGWLDNGRGICKLNILTDPTTSVTSIGSDESTEAEERLDYSLKEDPTRMKRHERTSFY